LGASRLVLGKHSGRHAFAKRLEELGYSLSPEDFERAFARFKDLADRKKEVHDEDIDAIVTDEIRTVPEEFHLEYMTVTVGLGGMPCAAIRIRRGDETLQDVGTGVGGVDAVYRTIDKIVGIPHALEDYTVKSITGGTDALGEVTVRLRDNGTVFTGRGASLDIIEASAKAYIQAINKLVYYRKHRG